MSRPSLCLLGAVALGVMPTAFAAERVQVISSFSILADMVENVGGDHVKVTSLVGPDGDAHAYSPRPGDARALSSADLVVFNGLRFEGWMDRLLEASDYQGALVTATRGIDALSRAETADEHHDEHHDGHGDEHHDEHGDEHHDGHGDEHAHGTTDPHAWQSLTQARVYVTNIRDGLIEADAENAATYRANAARYLDEMAATDARIRALVSEIPDDTSIITGHDSFGYFANAYGLEFLSPAGLSTGVSPSASEMATLIDVIREENVQALFHENMTNQSILRQLADETGLPVAGTLYSDALSAEGQASTYLGMMLHNAEVLNEALTSAMP